MMTKTPPEMRFWEKVRIGGLEECWPWIGNRTKRGYGKFAPHPKRRTKDSPKGKSEIAHRFGWTLIHGPVPAGFEVAHSCDNPPCCNPCHLWLATHKQNMEDMIGKGRWRGARGEKQGSAKLTEQAVIEIKRLLATGEITHRRIASKFLVSPETISKIACGKNWKHVA
jgi:hypothetical protein